MYKIVCIAGMPGAGKSTVADIFAESGYYFIRFGQIVLDEIKKRNLEQNETNEKFVREDIRKKMGMAAMAELNIPRIDEHLKKENVVIDGLYAFAEYKIMKDKYHNQMIVIAVWAPPELRYNRISQRKAGTDDKDLRNHGFTKEEARARDYHEIEALNKGGPIAMADYTLINTQNLIYLQQQVNELMQEIENN